MRNAKPVLNADSESRWDDDCATAKTEIMEWLATAASELGFDRDELEARVDHDLSAIVEAQDLVDVIRKRAGVLKTLRALTYRDIGTAQMSNFLGVGSTTYERMEAGKKNCDDIANDAAELIIRELDHGLAGWLFDDSGSREGQRERARSVVADRIIRRESSTAMRYMHEPRQLSKLSVLLERRGYRNVSGQTVNNPRTDLAPGTFAERVNVVGKTPAGKDLTQSVDTLIMPRVSTGDTLPIFLEAKSMTDVVNPNKRQKEEAQKADCIRRAWEREDDRVSFLLLLGGTVPRRYLEIEKASGLDWIWEHRVNDLNDLLDWYEES